MLQKIKFLLIFLLLFNVAFAQNSTFYSLADEINRISIHDKTKALKLLDSLYAIANSDPDSALCLARYLYEESIFNVYQGFADTAMPNKIKQRLAKPNLAILEEAMLQSALAINLLTLGSYSEAFTINLQALEKYKQIGNKRFTAKTLNSLGNICSMIAMFSLAEYYYAEAILLLTPEFYEYYITKSNIFKILARSDCTAAVDSLYLLIETVENENRIEILPLLYLNTGSMLLSIYPEQALSYFDKMQNLNIDNPQLNAALSCNKGVYFFMQKNYPKALTYLRNSQQHLETSNDFESLSEVYNLLSQVFEKQNHQDSALIYLQKSYELTLRLHTNTVAIETHQKYITNFLETSKKDLTIAEQKNKLKNKQLIIFAVTSGAIIILILLFLLLVNQQKLRKASENRELTAKLEHEKARSEHEKKVQQYEKRTQKLEREKQQEVLDAKTREITSYSLLVSNKNQLLQQIMELTAQIFNNKENATKTAAKIEEVIQNNLTIDKEWVNFKMHFDNVHPLFFEKLKQCCHDLTEENVKMCAYIKMGMTPKQIAQLQHVAPRSVIINRYRLKKKLQLPEEEDLEYFVGKL